MNALTAADLVRDLALAFPRSNLTAAAASIYERELLDIPPAELANAIRLLIRTEDHFPSVAAIRRTVAEEALRLPTADEALAQLQSHPRHPLVDRALSALGGIYALRNSSEPSIFQAQFLRLYREMRDQAVREVQMGGVSNRSALSVSCYP